MGCAIYGAYQSSLGESFLSYISPVERDLVKCSLQNFEDVDEIDPLKFIESHQCRNLAKKTTSNQLF